MGEIDQILRVRSELPVDPRQLRVLAIGVVVALLRTAHLVAAQNHRNTLRQQQGSKEIPLLPLAQRADRRIVGRAFDAAVPAAIVGFAVAVVFAVGLVVLFVVADEVVQRESVVRGDEIDACRRAPALEQVARSRQPRRQLADDAAVPLPVRAYGVAILAVPFRPARGEISDLIAVLTEVPRLGDQLDVRELRILADAMKKTALLIDQAIGAAERRSEVETKAVD